ncbi:MAG: FAD-dependent oxidoreductase [Candidatus Saelkia tenebricola]|nr:FAD-dependent oxidoreductase [Candidatus Saelkia tenebricola]
MTDSKEIKARLISKIQRTPMIISFRFSLDEKISFLPGQFMEVIFDEVNKDLRHWLSFSSSPNKDYIEFTKRISGSLFSEKLNALNSGDTVLLKLPLGRCCLGINDKKIVFLTGGIGITPAISIIEDIVEKNQDTNVVLFYSNKTEAEVAFKDELFAWENSNNNIRVIYTITENVSGNDKYIQGRISSDLIKDNLSDLNERMFFIFGPPLMVEALKNMLLAMGIDKSKIEIERFIGY